MLHYMAHVDIGIVFLRIVKRPDTARLRRKQTSTFIEKV